MTKYSFKGLVGGVALAMSVCVGGAALAFEGFGQDIPLESAARQIIPEGWTVDYGDGVDRKSSVSWSSAKDWKEALSSAVSKKGYVAQFGSSSVVIAKGSRVAQSPSTPAANPPKRTVKRTSEPRPTTPAKKAAPAARESGGGGFVIAPYHSRNGGSASSGWKPYAGVSKDGDDRVPATSDAVYAGGGYSVADGDDLRAVLDAWANGSGWKLVWNSEFKYPIAANATFSGDFVEATSELIKALSEARPAITVDFYKGNHVVVISNKGADEAN